MARSDISVKGLDGLERRLRAIGRTPQELMDDWVPRTIRNAKQNLEPHKKTGTTSRSIQPGPRGRDEASVQVGGAGLFIENGTRAHEIRPRRARILRWPANAGDRRLSGSARSGTTDFIYARRVRHPGTSADPFLVPGAESALEEFLGQDPVQRFWNKAD